MSIFLLEPKTQAAFASTTEHFPGGHLGDILIDGRAVACVVVNCLIAILEDEALANDLDRFYEVVWPSTRDGGHRPVDDFGRAAIDGRYSEWFGGLARASAIPAPPPPPTRPSVVPGGVYNPWAPRGHLPFLTTSRARETFYRCEPWPRSLRLSHGASAEVAPGTFASPQKERPFLPSGFAAVARCALPSWFPACFMYEFETQGLAPLRCGAVVPMFGQSGGGVEVLFTQKTPLNSIRPILLDPF